MRTIRSRSARGRVVGAVVFGCLGALSPGVPATAAPTAPTALTGTAYLPDGSTPALAAVVDLLRADATGRAIPGTAFARGVTDIDGHYTIDPPERPDLVSAAQTAGGTLTVAVQVGDLSENGSIDAGAGGGRAPDAAIYEGVTVLRLVTDGSSASGSTFEVPIDPVHVGSVPEPGSVDVNPPLVTATAELVLELAGTVKQRAQVLGMFTDPDLVAGNDDVNDPDLVPPLGSVIADVVPILESPVALEPGPSGGGGVGGVSIGSAGDLLPQPDKQQDNGSCGKDPGTQWVSSRHGNNIPGTKTYVYLDTYSCTKDTDPYRDEVIYKWAGYTGGADHRWSIYRLKYRTEINDKYNYFMKYPNPVGNHTGQNMTWSVGFEYFLSASVGGQYSFREKKIHGWQADGTGRLYHVSWISGKRSGTFGEGLNNGGGVNLDVPQGSNGRTGVKNNVLVWRCFWDPQQNWKATCDE